MLPIPSLYKFDSTKGLLQLCTNLVLRGSLAQKLIQSTFGVLFNKINSKKGDCSATICQNLGVALDRGRLQFPQPKSHFYFDHVHHKNQSVMP